MSLLALENTFLESSFHGFGYQKTVVKINCFVHNAFWLDVCLFSKLTGCLTPVLFILQNPKCDTNGGESLVTCIVVYLFGKHTLCRIPFPANVARALDINISSLECGFITKLKAPNFLCPIRYVISLISDIFFPRWKYRSSETTCIAQIL